MSNVKDSHKDAYWGVVEDCLVDLHKLPKQQAEQKCKNIRMDIESAPIDVVHDPIPDIFYHREPFDVSCDIAENYLDVNHYRDPYNQILRNHKW